MNELKLTGTPASGVLTSIENTVNGMKLDLSGNIPCWEIRIHSGNEIKLLDIGKFTFKAISEFEGNFTHKELPLSVTVKWRPHNKWAAACQLGYKTDGSVHVASIGFKMPDFIRPCPETEQDFLIYPFKTGIKIPCPAATVFEDYRRKDTRYGPAQKTRHLNVIENGMAPIVDGEIETEEIVVNNILNEFRQTIKSDRIVWGKNKEYTYPATISMTWLDYYGPNGGIYLGAHDSTLEKANLYFAAERGSKGIAPGIDKIFNRPVKEWTGDFILGLHEGDWHQGADVYREYMNRILPGVPDTPEYFCKAPGIISHYDMKWEDGTVTHRYSDLPEMHAEASKHGYDTLLLAGWNNGGFDNYSLNYSTEPELGSENELKKAISKVHDAGGKIFFYVNALSISCDTADFPLASNFAVRNKEGEIDYFGECFLVHPMATMCSSVKEWLELVKKNIKYVLLELNADGVYLDQIGSAPRDCYAPEHDHRNAWSVNYRNMLKEVRRDLAQAGKKEYVLLTERAMDLHKDLLDCFLCYSFWQCDTKLSFPAMFRYAFPEVKLIDMAMQKPWQGRFPVENTYVQETFCRQFVNGLKYWTYCHVPENETLKPFFDSAIKLFSYGVDYFSKGKFLDDINIQGNKSGIIVKEFHFPGKGRLFAVYNPTGNDVQFSLKENIQGLATVRGLSNVDSPAEYNANGNQLTVDSSLLSLIEIAEY
jgi:hypothetical protein